MGKGTKPSSDINPADFCSITSEINLAQAEHIELTCWERTKDGEEILMEIWSLWVSFTLLTIK